MEKLNLIPRIFLFTIMTNFVTVTPAAQLYKWVDEDGVPQYSETPPSTLRPKLNL